MTHAQEAPFIARTRLVPHNTGGFVDEQEAWWVGIAGLLASRHHLACIESTISRDGLFPPSAGLAPTAHRQTGMVSLPPWGGRRPNGAATAAKVMQRDQAAVFHDVCLAVNLIHDLFVSIHPLTHPAIHLIDTSQCLCPFSSPLRVTAAAFTVPGNFDRSESVSSPLPRILREISSLYR
ncbi:hypothetical protein JDV02_006535 [Purpureocillium takamizusanense]|uniref:Uncharacterized protein n=1 Tax=Purpureocillium takamizusanense TaxID=2060973 RepID=A0A9Q8VBF3_9HYPO|nr:uncharacterized protein JDV02_006535 [Purpureocillium takamizusanense]UNI20450.1 hypothetical protein JDV02_006535 [Purpureocillium takamizusanense]